MDPSFIFIHPIASTISVCLQFGAPIFDPIATAGPVAPPRRKRDRHLDDGSSGEEELCDLSPQSLYDLVASQLNM